VETFAFAAYSVGGVRFRPDFASTVRFDRLTAALARQDHRAVVREVVRCNCHRVPTLALAS
jgi:hypothetical protein